MKQPLFKILDKKELHKVTQMTWDEYGVASIVVHLEEHKHTVFQLPNTSRKIFKSINDEMLMGYLVDSLTKRSI